MKQGWEIKKLGEVCKLTNGFAFQSKQYNDDGYFVIRIGNVQDGYIDLNNPRYIKLSEEKQKKFILSDGDILISLTGNVGRVGIMGGEHLPAVLNQRVAKISIGNTKLDKSYLFYFLKSEFFIAELIKAGRGAAQQNISTTDIENLTIPLPPLPEQQRIVAILDEAFAAIAKAKANAEQNLKNTKELFESYLQGVFDNYGEGWEENIIKEVCDLKSGTTISPSLERLEGDVLYTKVSDMNLPGNEIEINTSSRFVNSKEIKINQIIPEGAIIFPKRGGAIATNKKRKVIKPTIVDLNTMAIIQSNKIDKDYFFYWFQLFDLNSISNGTSIPQINNYSFDEVHIPYPSSVKEQRQIVQQIDNLLTETVQLGTNYKRKLYDLEELKKSVLQKAFAGELNTSKMEVFS